MSNAPLQAPIPSIDIEPGMKLVLEAISPTTGASITGVTATAWAIYGEGDENAEPLKPLLLPPLLAYPGNT